MESLSPTKNLGMYTHIIYVYIYILGFDAPSLFHHSGVGMTQSSTSQAAATRVEDDLRTLAHPVECVRVGVCMHNHAHI